MSSVLDIVIRSKCCFPGLKRLRYRKVAKEMRKYKNRLYHVVILDWKTCYIMMCMIGDK